MNKLLPIAVLALVSTGFFLRAETPSVFAEGDVSPFPDPNPVPSWTITNGLVIGQGSMGALTIEGGGTVSGDGMIFVGLGSGGEGQLTVTGEGSLLTNSSNLSIGYNGAVGTLTIADGGAVIFSGGGAIEGGSAMVTGTGSLWNSGGLHVSSSEGLTIADGGAVTSGFSDIYSSGSVTVTGAGSAWNAGGLHVNSTNGLTIADGGSVSSGGGNSWEVNHIGYWSEGRVTVTGAGSTWTTTNEFRVGHEGGKGTLVIADGGVVHNLSEYWWDGINIGHGSNSHGHVTVTGAGSLWTNNGNLGFGDNGGVGVMVVTNGGSVIDTNHFSDSYVLDGSSVTVVGEGSSWTTAGSISVYGTNGLVVAEGGTVTSSNGVIHNGSVTISGEGASWGTYAAFISGGGLVTVTGAGSSLNASVLSIESTNGLVVADGGAVSSGGAGYWEVSSIGAWSEGRATVTGAGSTWTTTNEFRVGHEGGKGTLIIEDGGTVANLSEHWWDGINIGRGSNSHGQVTVSGAGSLWTNNGNLGFGDDGGTGVMVVTNGGSVVDTNDFSDSYISEGSSVTVGGAGSTWTTAGSISVYGTNGLVVAEGGTVTSSNGVIHNGSVTISGEGASWGSHAVSISGDGSLAVTGASLSAKVLSINSTNGLVVADGASVFSGGGEAWEVTSIGDWNDGRALVTGIGSTWTTTNDFHIGANGRVGMLAIEQGGHVASLSGIWWETVQVGFDSQGHVTVDGVGSRWTLDGNLYLGGNGGAGTMVITNGGVVDGGASEIYDGSSVMVVGEGSSWTTASSVRVHGANGLTILDGGSVTTDSDTTIHSGGTVTVTGAGSWLNADSLAVAGYNGLVISDGGRVATPWFAEIHSGGSVSVTGPGSSLVAASLYVDGSNGLTIADGGMVSSGGTGWGEITRIGGHQGGVMVTGAGSSWTITNAFRVGEYADEIGTLIIADGGTVINHGPENIQIGYRSGSEGHVTVTGAGSLWTNQGNIGLGYAGGVGALTITNGGIVTDANDTSSSEINSGSSVVVAGYGSSWTTAGSIYVRSTNGLMISDGGSVVSRRGEIHDGSVTIAGIGSSWNVESAHIGGTGFVSVVGAGSSWTAEQLYISSANGLVISNGGRFSSGGEDWCSFTYIGDGDEGGVTVTGAGSLWTNTGNLVFGDNGGHVGVMILVADGGTIVDANEFSISDILNGSSVMVSGEGSSWTTAGSLNVHGTNGMTIQHEGAVAVRGKISISNDGTVVLDGGRLTVGSIEGLSNLNFLGGMLVANGTLAGNLAVPEGGTLGGAFVIAGNLDVSGVLSPGNSPDLSTVEGDLTLDLNSVTVMELAGYSRGMDYDAINVFGNIAYGGTLSIVFLDGFLPEIGDTFDLFLFDGEQSGLFGSIEFATPGASGVFHYESGVLEIMTVPEPGTWALLIMGSALLAVCVIRRRSRLF